ncbi:DNA mismatch repair endonuclease MutL [Psittacicella gerlachiana]|uniref:DNA mismatch repair protein MutL n=1 Tax=Psittacicella gerlachiana TaxID=2028574 RepID=A0A3A1Y7M4_9GAMM|nr:DNA mismatch repair endonuclease MutL [Psittacicella gerlachiana]RIY33615.1 hypothetical protein CKF59_06265 [Psittacicella gerlachiana]
MTKIQVLPPLVANQIAAGEVVERPASIVKELIENSIDAQSTQILIEIEDGGKQLIRIRDNGIGIEKEQLDLALAPHATSKLRDIADLETLISYGFRGEALASISSVSKLTLTSRHQQAEVGWQIYNQGKEYRTSSSPIAHPIGTTIEVQELFYNTPARQKFLKSANVEFNHIEDLIQRLAIVNPHIDWTLTHNGKQRLRLPKLEKEAFRERILQAMPQTFSDTAVEICASVKLFNLKLRLILEPNAALSLKSNRIQYSYINQRMIKDKVIISAVKQAFTELFNNVNLNYILFLEIDSSALDINVHPAKAEVRFVDAHKVHSFIFQNLYVQLAKIRNFDPKIVDLVLANRNEDQELIDRSQLELKEVITQTPSNFTFKSKQQDFTSKTVKISSFDNKKEFESFKNLKSIPKTQELKTSTVKPKEFIHATKLDDALVTSDDPLLEQLTEDLFKLPASESKENLPTPKEVNSICNSLLTSAEQKQENFDLQNHKSTDLIQSFSQPTLEQSQASQSKQGNQNLQSQNTKESHNNQLQTDFAYFKQLAEESKQEQKPFATQAEKKFSFNYQQIKEQRQAEKNKQTMLASLLGEAEVKDQFTPSVKANESISLNTKTSSLFKQLMDQELNCSSPVIAGVKINLNLASWLTPEVFNLLLENTDLKEKLLKRHEPLNPQDFTRPHWFIQKLEQKFTILTSLEQQTLWQYQSKVYLVDNLTLASTIAKYLLAQASLINLSEYKEQKEKLINFAHFLQTNDLAQEQVFATCLLLCEGLDLFQDELISQLQELSYPIL